MRRHRAGKHNSLERPQASEEEDEMAADGTSHVDQAEDFVFKTEVGVDLETSQVAARHFKLANFGNNKGRHQEAQIGGEIAPFKQTLRKLENSNNSTSCHMRESCDQPATAGADVDSAE